MIDQIIAVCIRLAGAGRINAIGFFDLFDFRFGSGQADNLRVKIGEIGAQGVGRIARRIDRDEKRLQQTRLSGGFVAQYVHGRTDPVQRGRAHIRAIGKAEENQQMAVGKIAVAAFLARLVGQGERPADLCRQPRLRGGVGVSLGQLADQKGGQQNQADGGNGKAYFLTFRHLFLLATMLVYTQDLNMTQATPNATAGREYMAKLDQPAIRLSVQLFLRWLAISGQSAAVAVVYFGFGFDLPLGPVLLVILGAVALNLALLMQLPGTHLMTQRQTALYLAFDIGQLGLLLFLTGGLLNPFSLLMLAQVTISASLLNARTTMQLVVFAMVIASLLAMFHLPLPWDGPPPVFPSLIRFGLWVAMMLALAFIPTYVWRVTREGRRMSAALTATRAVLAREQRLSALDGLAAAAAHQLGTPLGTIVLVSGELEGRADLPDDLRDDVRLMREQAIRCRNILTDLASEDNDPVLSKISLRGLLEEAVLESGLNDKKVHVSCRANGLLATGEPQLTRQPELIYGLGNLIENAAEFAAGAVWVSATYSPQQVVLEVADDGDGFAPDILARLGAPYTSSRRRDNSVAENDDPDDGQFGLGLGFFIARTLLQRSGAEVTARNLSKTELIDGAMPGGACVRVAWPRARLTGQAENSD